MTASWDTMAFVQGQVQDQRSGIKPEKREMLYYSFSLSPIPRLFLLTLLLLFLVVFFRPLAFLYHSLMLVASHDHCFLFSCCSLSLLFVASCDRLLVLWPLTTLCRLMRPSSRVVASHHSLSLFATGLYQVVASHHTLSLLATGLFALSWRLVAFQLSIL